MAMIYRAPWKSHECPTRALSIPEVEPYLCVAVTVRIQNLTKNLTFFLNQWHHYTLKISRNEWMISIFHEIRFLVKFSFLTVTATYDIINRGTDFEIVQFLHTSIQVGVEEADR